jgi:hypothetical protein
MAKASAPAKLTGGRGFCYEDLVAARFLLAMLGAAHPLGPDLGQLVRIDWQSGDAGWRLDDLALTFGAGDEERCAGMSNKSHKQVTEGGFNDTFTRACWEQRLGVSTTRPFREDRDLLVLVTGVLADGVRTGWDALLGAAIETAAAPERLVARLQPPATQGGGSLSSEMQRSLFESLRCPADLQAGASTDDVATARLARHVRLLHLDFESVPSRALTEALAECRGALEGGTDEKAQELWNALVGIAWRKRGRGGSIDLRELLSRLRRQFSLRGHPDYQPDWDEVDRRSRERSEAVGLSVGNTSPLSRRSVRRRLSRHLHEGRACVVVGESGGGKSAVVRRLGEGGRYRLVWLTGDQLHSGRQSAFEEHLGLRHPFTQVLAASPRRCLVVFDGVEGFSEPALQLVARLIGTIRAGSCGTPRIVLTSQPDGLARLQGAFASAKVPLEPWAQLTVRPPGEEAVQRLLGRFPGLSWAALRPEFRSLLRNLKVFDWVVRLHESGGLPETATVTLTAIIDRLWAHFVEAGEGGLARSSLLKRVGATEADQLMQGLPLQQCEPGDLAAIPALETAGLVRRQDERVRFTHDMLADWARLKHLVEQRLTESDSAILRAATAGWYRAVRLYAQRTLEQPGEGLARWHRDVRALGGGNPERVIVRDLFLEALVLTNDSRALVSATWPALVEGEGELLSLLLERFAHVGTVADWRVLSGIEDPALAAQLEHLYRVPFDAYWYGVLPVLAEHPEDVIRCALAPAAKLLRLWLSTVPPRQRVTVGLRRAAARLTLTIAREVQSQEAEGRSSIEEEVRTDVYVALLWAVPEFADEAAQLCLELANRRPEADPVRQRREAAREEGRLATERLNAERPETAALTRRMVTPDDVFGPRRAPWPDGPNHRVDEAFQKACLDRQAIFPLVVNRPREALEVILAVVIEHPRRHGWGEGSLARESLGLDDNHQNCHPAFFHQGPFLALLRSSEETAAFALGLIIRVTNFATERWQEHHHQLTAKYPDLAREGPTCVTVPTAEGWKAFSGDRNVLRWHDGWASQPDVLSSMLMAVERWLYDEADGGRPIDRWVEQLLNEGRSAALVGVLVAVANYKPELLRGPLRMLAGAWEVYVMEPRLQMERGSIAFWSMHWMRCGEGAWNRAPTGTRCRTERRRSWATSCRSSLKTRRSGMRCSVFTNTGKACSKPTRAIDTSAARSSTLEFTRATSARRRKGARRCRTSTPGSRRSSRKRRRPRSRRTRTSCRSPSRLSAGNGSTKTSP